MNNYCIQCKHRAKIYVNGKPMCIRHYILTESKKCLRAELLRMQNSGYFPLGGKDTLRQIKKLYPDLYIEFKPTIDKYLN